MYDPNPIHLFKKSAKILHAQIRWEQHIKYDDINSCYHTVVTSADNSATIITQYTLYYHWSLHFNDVVVCVILSVHCVALLSLVSWSHLSIFLLKLVNWWQDGGVVWIYDCYRKTLTLIVCQNAHRWPACNYHLASFHCFPRSKM